MTLTKRQSGSELTLIREERLDFKEERRETLRCPN